MVEAEQLKAVLEAMASGPVADARREAERQLESWIQELLDAKVRHSLTASSGLDGLTYTALTDAKGLSPAGAMVLDRFRYRLAHVAMRNQQWEQASRLLDVVLQGSGELTRARLYRTVCTLRERGRIDDESLRELVSRYRQEGVDRPSAPSLDVLVQEPTTCLLELLLLCQGSEPQLLDQLYEDQGRHRTTGLKLCIRPERGRSSTVVLSEWLAQAHLDELAQERWLVVDTTVDTIGELGRGSKLRSPNCRAQVLVGIAQVLGRAAASAGAGNTGLNPDVAQGRFLSQDDGRLVDPERPPRWQYVTSAVLAAHSDRKVFRKEDLENTWRLVPPYVVVLRDSATAVRQAAGRSQ
ncbi:MAG: hypothetical protein VKM34_08430 [Cyanobacteriota bacterium]|nr:hypothetical protein [Cyanobacteriota bacterium]